MGIGAEEEEEEGVMMAERPMATLRSDCWPMKHSSQSWAASVSQSRLPCCGGLRRRPIRLPVTRLHSSCAQLQTCPPTAASCSCSAGPG